MKGKWGKPGRPPKWFLEEQTQAAELVHEVDDIDEIDEIDEGKLPRAVQSIRPPLAVQELTPK